MSHNVWARTLFCGALFGGLICSRAAAEPTRWIAPDEVSLGAVRVTDDWLQKNGLSKDRAWHATGVLLAWLHDSGTLSDENLRKALIPLVVMLRNGAADLGEMDKLCRVAPKCRWYMAEGAGLNPANLSSHLRNHDLEAKSALSNMFVSAGLDHIGKGEWEIVRKARQLKTPTKK